MAWLSDNSSRRVDRITSSRIKRYTVVTIANLAEYGVDGFDTGVVVGDSVVSYLTQNIGEFVWTGLTEEYAATLSNELTQLGGYTNVTSVWNGAGGYTVIGTKTANAPAGWSIWYKVGDEEAVDT